MRQEALRYDCANEIVLQEEAEGAEAKAESGKAENVARQSDHGLRG